MKTKTKTLTAIAIAAALGGTALAGASYAGHRGGGHGLDLIGAGPLGLSAMEVFDAIDADGDGKLTQAEIDKARNDRHAAHDADGDGNLEPRGVRRAVARDHPPAHRARVPDARHRRRRGGYPRRVRPPARRHRRAARPRPRRRPLAAGPPARRRR